MWIKKIVAACGLGALYCASAIAQTCAPFTDVPASDPFCSNIQWMFNRGVTLGCTAPPGQTWYCPAQSVRRDQMAAFMNRFGNALQPVFLQGIESGAEAVVNAGGVICQTIVYSVANYARVASASAMLYHQAPTSQTVIAALLYSLNSGVSWTQLSGSPSRATNPANGFASQSPVAQPLVLQPGQSVQFGIGASGAGTIDAVCELSVRLDNHSGLN